MANKWQISNSNPDFSDSRSEAYDYYAALLFCIEIKNSQGKNRANKWQTIIKKCQREICSNEGGKIRVFINKTKHYLDIAICLDMFY